MLVKLCLSVEHRLRLSTFRSISHRLLQQSKQFYSAMTTTNNKAKVFVTRPDIPEPALKLLKDLYDVEIWPKVNLPRENLLQMVKDKDALFCLLTEKIDEDLLKNAGPKLKVVCTMSAGYDHIDVEACKKYGVAVGYTPGVLTAATAELCIALLLATARRLIEATAEVTNGGWAANKWAPMYMAGAQISGSTVGIVGLGKIGFAVAQRLRAFEVKRILYCGHSIKPDAESIGAEFVQFKELLQMSDFIIAACALTDETKELFNEKAFNQMKPTAIFINITRGALVDQDALLNALMVNKIKAAGLDVTTPEPLPVDHPLLKQKNCVIIPHIGSATVETRLNMAMVTAKNIIACLQGTKMPSKLC